MAKNYTFPFLFDEVKSLSITDLKKLKYLQQNYLIKGTVNWVRQGENSGSINIKTSLNKNDNYVEFNYICNDIQHNYKVNLVFTKSNLNKGDIWYFKCKYTGVRCRKLHLINGIFQHRSILKTGMYSTQTTSKSYRELEKTHGAYFKFDIYYTELRSKYFKKYYRGKPTKRYLRLMKLTSQIH
ncbi:hypothetical protein [Wenyingzhuangia sp. 2_MG-2023]|uniref:hypothetical protein n=1 Tax=Wenyingzhuangia sp. 2_MG-2023 TaxID=3062639 RepID=UPI0026E40580|nr:hypothetical protein [Wenyingzhuangia sp. 2_MG-2023]MDO6736517.1 hypothetical protein [Wenyingzhuangia sp. 2_MG-2023]